MPWRVSADTTEAGRLKEEKAGSTGLPEGWFTGLTDVSGRMPEILFTRLQRDEPGRNSPQNGAFT